MPKPHKNAIEAIRKYITLLGGTANILSQSGRLYGSAGIPDVYIQYGTLSFWVEVKVGKDTLSLAQRAFKEREEACGGTVVVGDVGDVIAYLER